MELGSVYNGLSENGKIVWNAILDRYAKSGQQPHNEVTCAANKKSYYEQLYNSSFGTKENNVFAQARQSCRLAGTPAGVSVSATQTNMDSKISSDLSVECAAEGTFGVASRDQVSGRSTVEGSIRRQKTNTLPALIARYDDIMDVVKKEPVELDNDHGDVIDMNTGQLEVVSDMLLPRSSNLATPLLRSTDHTLSLVKTSEPARLSLTEARGPNKPTGDNNTMPLVNGSNPGMVQAKNPSMSLVRSSSCATPRWSTPNDCETGRLETPSSCIAEKVKQMKNKENHGDTHDKTSSFDAALAEEHSSAFYSRKKVGGFAVKSAGKKLKLSTSVTDDVENNVEFAIKNIENFCASELSDIVKTMATVSQACLCLLYDSGSSQLSDVKARFVDRRAVNVGISLYKKVDMHLDSTRFYVVPLHGPEETLKKSREFIDALMSCDASKICFNGKHVINVFVSELKFDYLQVLQKWASLLDVRIGAWLLDPEDPKESFQDVIKGLKMQNLQSKDDDNSQVICKDLDTLHKVMRHICKRLKEEGLWHLYTNIEMPLTPILTVMEHSGIKMDTGYLAKAAALLQAQISRVELLIHKAAGHRFLVNSHAQLRQVLFDELKLDEQLKMNKSLRTTAIGNLKSTSEFVLTKMKSTYIDGLSAHINNSGYLFTSWKHTAAVTGRLTSANPNIQAVPKETMSLQATDSASLEEKVTIKARDAFISHHGNSFVTADFRQIELRLLAHLADDPYLLKMFNSVGDGTDIFRRLTSFWLAKPVDEVFDSDRERTKRIVYSVMYGVGRDRLAEYLKTTPDQASKVMNSFLSCVSTIFNRKRWLKDINSPNFSQRALAERQAVNFVVQGSAADICKAAMIHVQKTLCDRPHLRARLLIQIHDELLLEVPDGGVREVADLLSSTMQDVDALCGAAVRLRVPLPVTVSVGKTWGSVKNLI